MVTSTSKIRRMVSVVIASVRSPSIASLPRCKSTIRSAKRIARLRSCSTAITAVPFCARPRAVSTRSIWWRMSRLEVGSSSSNRPGPCCVRRRRAAPARGQNARAAARRPRASAIAGAGKRQSDLAERRIDQPLRGGAPAVAGAHTDDFLDREREGDVDMLRQHRAVMGEHTRRIEVDVALLQFDLPAGRP